MCRFLTEKYGSAHILSAIRMNLKNTTGSTTCSSFNNHHLHRFSLLSLHPLQSWPSPKSLPSIKTEAQPKSLCGAPGHPIASLTRCEGSSGEERNGDRHRHMHSEGEEQSVRYSLLGPIACSGRNMYAKHVQAKCCLEIQPGNSMLRKLQCRT